MKIFADHCVNKDSVVLLRELGHKVERAIEAKLAEAFDEQIFAHAQKRKQVLLTFDKDFGNIINFDILRSKGVVVVYIHKMSKESLLETLKAFFAKKQAHALAGKLFIIEADGVRIWPKK